MYIMESDKEVERLEKKTKEETTIRHLKLAGLESWMLAADFGCGSGAVTRTMAKMCRRATGYDASAERVRESSELALKHNIHNLCFAIGNVQDLVIINNYYDFAWSRFLFEYLCWPETALNNMIDSVKVGGKVVVADLDGNCNQHYPYNAEVEVPLQEIMDHLSRAGTFDPFVGRKLYSMFHSSGRLKDIKVHIEPYHLYAGAIPDDEVSNWEQKLESIKPAVQHLFEAPGGSFDFWAGAFINYLKDPATFTYSTLIMVSGTKIE